MWLNTKKKGMYAMKSIELRRSVHDLLIDIKPIDPSKINPNAVDDMIKAEEDLSEEIMRAVHNHIKRSVGVGLHASQTLTVLQMVITDLNVGAFRAAITGHACAYSFLHSTNRNLSLKEANELGSKV